MGDSSEISNPKPMKILAYGGDRRGVLACLFDMLLSQAGGGYWLGGCLFDMPIDCYYSA